MKKFTINIIIFTVILITSALCLDVAVSKGLRKDRSKLFSKLTKAYKGEINAELIINGSSKAFVQVDPAILDSITSLKTYNLGLDGSPFIPQMALFELYKLHNKKPKVIVQIVSNGTLRSLSIGFRNPVKFAPYLNIPVVKKYMKLTGAFSSLDYKVPLLRYSSSPFEVITGVLSLFNINVFNHEDDRGYSPNNKQWTEEYPNTSKIGYDPINKEFSVDSLRINEFTSLDSTSCKLFEEYLDECRSDSILVFLVYPPIYYESFCTIKYVDYYKKIAKKHDCLFLNYSQDSLLAFNRKYFYNSQHLNTEGATVFTKQLSKDVKANMRNSILVE